MHFKRISGLAMAFAVAAGLCWFAVTTPAQDGNKPEAAAVERTRTMVKMLDDLYKNAVVSITDNYVELQSSIPAASIAKDVFAAMHKKGWHSARLIDAIGKPKNKANVAKSEFEKKVVEKLRAGESYVEEIAQVDGKPIFRAGTIVPAVMKQCTVCHGVKEGKLLGAIVYELPIK